MRLPDGPRQIAAGLLASVAFLALFFAAGLVWLMALLLAGLVYAAALLLIGRRTPLDEIRLTDRVSAADIQAAAADLDAAATRLAEVAPHAPWDDRAPIVEMAKTIRLIRQSILEDPEDYRAARSFIAVHLPRIVQTVESYVKLSQSARGDVRARLAGLSEQIRGFGGIVDRIHRACVENDLRALEIEVSVLSQQMERR